MKVCPNCGKVNLRNDQDFCTKCGTQFNMKNDPNGTIQGGMDALSKSDLRTAIDRFSKALKNGSELSDDDYQAIVEGSRDAIIKQIPDKRYMGCVEFVEFSRAVYPDRRFMEDLMESLMQSRSVAKEKMEIIKLAGEYMYLALESYGVYPNLKDMVSIMHKANTDMEQLKSQYKALNVEDVRADMQFEFYLKYTEEIADRMNSRISYVGREEMATLVKYWESKKKLTYADAAIVAANTMSKSIISFTHSKRREQDKNDKINDFLYAYFEQPFQPKPAKKSLWK